MTDPLDQQRLQPPPRIVLRHPRHPAIHHCLDPVQGQRSLRHIRGHHHLRPVIFFQRRILIRRCHLPMERQNHRLPMTQPRFQIPPRPIDFISPRQKYQHIPFPLPDQPLRLPGRHLGRPRSAQILPPGQILDIHRKHPPFRPQHLRPDSLRQLLGFERSRHHDQNQIRPRPLLQIQNPSQS